MLLSLVLAVPCGLKTRSLAGSLADGVLAATTLMFPTNNNYQNQLLQTGFSECTEAIATSLIPLATILPEICDFTLVLDVLCGLK